MRRYSTTGGDQSGRRIHELTVNNAELRWRLLTGSVGGTTGVSITCGMVAILPASAMFHVKQGP
jgi:hypothetical protein